MIRDGESFQDYTEEFFKNVAYAVSHLDRREIFDVADCIAYTQFMHGRLFILGLGGIAGNATHAVSDFRKLCGIEAYCPTDNVSEMTARINDYSDGWDFFFVDWLKISQLSEHDTVMVLSVSGGDSKSRVSRNIVNAVNYAKECGAGVVGIIGRHGYTYAAGDACVVIPMVEDRFTTPVTESLQPMLWHLIANSLPPEKK